MFLVTKRNTVKRVINLKGAFQTTREIFEHPIWTDIPKFRIFFYIYGNAVYSQDGVTIGDIHLKRGQLLRSYRQLQEDLKYIENRSIKKYSLSLIKRKIDSLVEENRLKIEDTELGTLFTVVNYELYQGFGMYDKTNIERRENAERTARERSENNNKKDNKDKKDIYIAAADIYNAREESIGGVPTTESAQLSNGSVGQIPGDSSQEDYERIKNLYMQLSGKGGFDVSPKDEMAINELLQTGIDVDKALVWLKECFDNYKPKHSRDKINSFSYCVPYILDKHYAEKEGAKVGKIQQHRGSTSSLERKDSITNGQVGWLFRKRNTV